MNIFIFTARIIKHPKLLRTKTKTLTSTIICVPNSKKSVPFYLVRVNGSTKVANEIFDIYRKGDFVMVEGLIHIKSQRIKINSKYIKYLKSIDIKVNKIHPASLII